MVKPIGYNKKKLLEKVYNTKKLTTKKTEYVWVIYKRWFSTSIQGLLLYDLKNMQEENDVQIIEDMLKILYGYLAIIEGQFHKKLHKITNRYKKEMAEIKSNLEIIENSLRKTYWQMPMFIRTLLQQSFDLISDIIKREEQAFQNIVKIIEISEQVAEEESVPVRVFASFFSEVQAYQQFIEHIEKVVKNDKEVMSEIEKLAEVFSKEVFFSYLQKLLKRVRTHIETLKFYKEFLLTNNLIFHSFSECILDPYKPLVRNDAFVEHLSIKNQKLF